MLAQLIFEGLALGAIYALVALGFVVIYRSSKVFNFAQGELLAFGALMMVTLHEAGIPWAVSLVGTMILTGIVAALAERLVLRPLIGRPVFVTAIVTIFVGLVMRVFMIVSWGAEPVGMSPTPWEADAAMTLGESRIWFNSLGAVVAALLALAAFFWLMKRTRFGVAMRATASDQEVALALGIPVGRVFGLSWFIAGGMAALAGVFLGCAPRSVEVNLAYTALAAFPALIVGGLDSPVGAVIASFLLGVLQVLAEAYINPLLGEFGKGFHLVFPYIVMILFLMVLPYGLFGKRDVERV